MKTTGYTHVRLPHKHGYPGNGMYYVICDVCGIKIRSKDTVLVQDKFNTQHNLIVCKKDADETNPQQYLKAVRERQIDNPQFIRGEGADNYISNQSDPTLL